MSSTAGLARQSLPPYTLRLMLPADLPRTIELQKASFRYPWSQELLRRELDHEWSTVMLAETVGAPGPQLLGSSIFWIVADELHLLSMAVAPDARRRGVASTLLQAALARARARDCVLATLEVRRSNRAAQCLYESFGFKPVGLRPNYYVEEREDAVVMMLDLTRVRG